MAVGANCCYKVAMPRRASILNLFKVGTYRDLMDLTGASDRKTNETRNARNANRNDQPARTRIRLGRGHIIDHETHTHHVRICSYLLVSARICSNRPSIAHPPPEVTGGARAAPRREQISNTPHARSRSHRSLIISHSVFSPRTAHALAKRHDVTGEETLSARVAGKSYSSTLSVPAAEATCKFRGTNAALGRVWLQDPQRAKRYRHAPKGPRSRPFPPWSGCLPCCSLSQT